MIYAYYRVSTDKQDYESQKFGVEQYCKRAGLTIDKELVDEGISGTVLVKYRKIGTIVRQLKKDDLIIVSELSRIGRSTADVISTCQQIIKKGANCIFVKQGLSLDNSPMGKMMVAILSAFAEMERDLISQRTIEGLARRKSQGLEIGRRTGSKNKTYVGQAQIDSILNWYSKGFSARQITNLLKRNFGVWMTPPTVLARIRQAGELTRNVEQSHQVMNQIIGD